MENGLHTGSVFANHPLIFFSNYYEFEGATTSDHWLSNVWYSKSEVVLLSNTCASKLKKKKKKKNVEHTTELFANTEPGTHNVFSRYKLQDYGYS